MVDTRDSKSCANKRAGSSPVEGIYFISKHINFPLVISKLNYRQPIGREIKNFGKTKVGCGILNLQSCF